MNGWMVAAPAVFSLSAATVRTPQAAVPAWQKLDFVMEEVVVTAVRPAWQAPGFVMEEVVVNATLPAWQAPDYVMEEVVATVTAADVNNAWRGRMHRRARILVAQLAREESAE